MIITPSTSDLTMSLISSHGCHANQSALLSHVSFISFLRRDMLGLGVQMNDADVHIACLIGVHHSRAIIVPHTKGIGIPPKSGERIREFPVREQSVLFDVRRFV